MNNNGYTEEQDYARELLAMKIQIRLKLHNDPEFTHQFVRFTGNIYPEYTLDEVRELTALAVNFIHLQ
jgi:hypothetical protein